MCRWISVQFFYSLYKHSLKTTFKKQKNIIDARKKTSAPSRFKSFTVGGGNKQLQPRTRCGTDGKERMGFPGRGRGRQRDTGARYQASTAAAHVVPGCRLKSPSGGSGEPWPPWEKASDTILVEFIIHATSSLWNMQTCCLKMWNAGRICIRALMLCTRENASFFFSPFPQTTTGLSEVKSG